MIGLLCAILGSLAFGFGVGAGWMRSRCKRFERERSDEHEALWITQNAARMRRQVLDAVKDLRGRGDLPPVAASRIICRHLGLEPREVKP